MYHQLIITRQSFGLKGGFNAACINNKTSHTFDNTILEYRSIHFTLYNLKRSVGLFPLGVMGVKTPGFVLALSRVPPTIYQTKYACLPLSLPRSHILYHSCTLALTLCVLHLTRCLHPCSRYIIQHKMHHIF